MLSAKEIQEILPHRYPFLLVDKILELGETSAVGLKNVTIDEGFFQGHFPGNPVMPGVLIAEAIAQVGAIYILRSLEGKEILPLLASIERIRFHRPVYPGDQLIIKVERVSSKGNMIRTRVRATVGDQVAVEGEMMCALVSKKEQSS